MASFILIFQTATSFVKTTDVQLLLNHAQTPFIDICFKLIVFVYMCDKNGAIEMWRQMKHLRHNQNVYRERFYINIYKYEQTHYTIS